MAYTKQRIGKKPPKKPKPATGVKTRSKKRKPTKYTGIFLTMDGAVESARMRNGSYRIHEVGNNTFTLEKIG